MSTKFLKNFSRLDNLEAFMPDLWNVEKTLLSIDGITVKRDVILAPYTSYKIGGPTTLFIEPHNENAAGWALQVLHEMDVPLFVLGKGSNVLVHDNGWLGATLYIGENLKGFCIDSNGVVVLAGTSLFAFIEELVDNGLEGAELMAGIPGTVGGGVKINAGAFGQEIETTLEVVHGFY
ncbi:FAD-binding protein, partial [bacterium]|nr:FAD-binding protein [bacterium]